MHSDLGNIYETHLELLYYIEEIKDPFYKIFYFLNKNKLYKLH